MPAGGRVRNRAARKVYGWWLVAGGKYCAANARVRGSQVRREGEQLRLGGRWMEPEALHLGLDILAFSVCSICARGPLCPIYIIIFVRAVSPREL